LKEQKRNRKKGYSVNGFAEKKEYNKSMIKRKGVLS